MKNIIIIGLGFLVVAVIGTFAVLKIKNTDSNTGNGSKEALTFLINPTKSEVYTKSIKTGMENRAVQADFEQISAEAKLKEGSAIKTSSSGRASVLSPDESITNVGPNAEIVLSAIDNNFGTKVKLQSGAVWSRISKFSGSGSVYEMQTENMVGAVRGTAFATTFLNGISGLYVLEGTVWVNAVDPKTGEKIPGETLLVTAGKKISIDSANMPKNNADIKTSSVTQDDLKKLIIDENWDVPSRSRDLPDIESKPQNPPVVAPTSTPPTETQAPPVETVTTIKSVEPAVAVIFKDIVGFEPEIVLKGEKLSQVKKVLLDLNEISFKIISDTEIRANVPNTFKADVYNVSVLFGSNQNSTLYDILEVQWEPPEQTRETQYYEGQY